ncbi:hypothetical protein bcgnr5383_37130 [Bacillus cereus]|nr:Uncharacterised protein [Streptococcus pneumoniae]
MNEIKDIKNLVKNIRFKDKHSYECFFVSVRHNMTILELIVCYDKLGNLTFYIIKEIIMKRTTEFVLGLIDGIFGLIFAFIALMIGGLMGIFRKG